jgi:sugar lactone lactonase YvrE
LYVDDDKTIYLADFNNNRVMKWKYGARRGQVVAGGNGKGDGPHQLNRPYDVIVDKTSDSIIVSDNGNLRVVRWSRRNVTTRGEILIANIGAAGLAMDDDGFLYVADELKHEVRRYRIGDTESTLIAGGNGKGNRLDQLCEPWYVFIDRDRSVYVSDWGNHRVVKWEQGATQGIIVAGGHGKGSSLRHVSTPEGIVVDQFGTVYVADSWNDRIMRWPKGATKGSVIIGGNGLNCPIGLTFDHRVQRFSAQ